MEDKSIKTPRHLYLHRPPRREKEAAWKCLGLTFAIFVIALVMRLIAGLFN